MQIKAMPINWKLTTGSSKLTSIDVPYEVLEKLFGQPYHDDQRDKTTYEWHVKVGGCIHTIYDYKGAKWSIGGFPNANFAEELKEYILANA